jgi:hypothetical protein
VIAIFGARIFAIAIIAGAAGAAGRSLQQRNDLVAAIGAALAALSVGLLTDHPRRAKRAAIAAITSGAAAFALAWLTNNALGAAWPGVLTFSTSWVYTCSSTVVFGVLALGDLKG